MSLLELVRRGDYSKVEEHLEELKNKGGVELEEQLNWTDDDKGWTPLFYAVDKSDDLMVAALLRGGAIDTIDEYDEEDFTVLHLAVKKNCRSIVSMLLDSGGKINIKCKNSIYKGYTPLHFAVSRSSDNEKLVELLLDTEGVDVNASTAKGQTPLHVCAMGGAPAVLKMLLDTPQVDPVARDANGLMPVMLSAATEREASVEILLTNAKVREHINDGDANKDTALHHAYQIQLQRLYSNGYPAATSHDAIAYLIVRAGAALDVKNKEGTEPLFFPSESFASILQLTQKYGAAFPPSLLAFLEATPEALEKIPTTEEDKRELLSAHATYVKAHEQALIEDGQKGPCPLITLVPRGANKDKAATTTVPPKGHPSVDSGADISACPFFSKDKASNKQTPQAPTVAAPSTTTTTNTTEPPKGHPNILGGDISACPFFSKKNPSATSSSTAERVVAPSTTTSTTTTTTTTGEELKVKGKCPIPFHNQLVSPTFWLYVAVLIVAVLVARNV